MKSAAKKLPGRSWALSATTLSPRPAGQPKSFRAGSHADRRLDTDGSNPDTVFDELTVDGWIHIERMSAVDDPQGRWWMRLGDVDLHVEIVNGKATVVAPNAEVVSMGGGVRVLRTSSATPQPVTCKSCLALAPPAKADRKNRHGGRDALVR